MDEEVKPTAKTDAKNATLTELGSVLLIEDNQVTQVIVQSTLKGICYVDVVGTAQGALEKLSATHYDLILLDISLPDGDGFDLYQKIRDIHPVQHAPILFLTAKGERDDKLHGFSLGADDYIVKPFDAVELRLRIAAKLKHLKRQTTPPLTESLQVGPFVVNLGAQKISLKRPGGSEQPLDLTGNQFKIFFYLLRHPGEIISRDQLLQEIWGSDTHVSDRTVDTHVYAVRKVLGENADMIRSIHGRGYRFDLTPRT
jgi:DNA-binding response OmpR family regulator